MDIKRQTAEGELIFVVKHIAVLDIGTTGVRILVAKVNESGVPHIIAKVAMTCKGMKKCGIENEGEVVESIKKAVRKIKDQTETIVKSVYISIQGANLSLMHNTDVIRLSGESDGEEDLEITYAHIGTLLDKAASVELYEDEQLIDIVPVKYFINDEVQVHDPLNLAAHSLRVEADVVIGRYEYMKQITACVNAAGLSVDGFIPLALAMTGLLPEQSSEMKSVLLVDVGGTMTDYTLYYKNKPYVIDSVPVGGDHITNDLVQVLGIAPNEAETIKRDYPLAAVELVSNNVDVAVFSVDKGTQEVIKVSEIVEIMQARLESLFSVIAKQLADDDIQTEYIDRVILTGDGITKFKGLDMLCEQAFKTKLYPIDFSRYTGMKTVYTYASGMVMYISGLLPYGRRQSVIEKHYSQDPQSRPSANQVKPSILDKMKSFLAKFKE